MRKAGWYSYSLDPAEARPREREGFGCKHCGKLVAVKPFCDPAELGGTCPHGCGLICPACIDKPCTPLEMRLGRVEARRSYELRD